MSRSAMFSLTLLGLILSLISIFTLDYTLAPYARALAEGHEELWNVITDIGDSKYMGILLLALLVVGYIFGKLRPENPLWPALWKKSVLVLAAVIGTGIFVNIVKVIVGRARPYMGDIGFSPFTFGSSFASWPSGHTTSVFAFAAAAGMAYPALRWPLFIVAALTGFSRMVLDKHYLGDVIAGATFGTIGAILIYNWLRPKLGLK